MSALNSLDEYKPNDGDDDDDESCSSGVDENELEDGTHSEEDIEEDNEKVQFSDMLLRNLYSVIRKKKHFI